VKLVCLGMMGLGAWLIERRLPFVPHLFNQNRLEGLFGIVRSRSSTGSLSAASYQNMLGIIQHDNANHLAMSSHNYGSAFST
jgi:dUTPase